MKHLPNDEFRFGPSRLSSALNPAIGASSQLKNEETEKGKDSKAKEESLTDDNIKKRQLGPLSISLIIKILKQNKRKKEITHPHLCPECLGRCWCVPGGRDIENCDHSR